MRKIAISLLLLASQGARADATQLKYSVGGCATGLVVGLYADSQDDSKNGSTAGTLGINTAIGCLIGIGTGYLFSDTNDLEKENDNLKLEVEKYKELNKNVAISNDSELQHLPPEAYDTRCGKSVGIVPFCSDADGAYSSCDKKADFFMLDPKLAVKIIGFYSPDSCFVGPYMKDQQLKKYFKEEMQQLENRDIP